VLQPVVKVAACCRPGAQVKEMPQASRSWKNGEAVSLSPSD